METLTQKQKYDANEALAQRRRFGLDIPEGSVEYKTDLNTQEDTPVQSTASYRLATKEKMSKLDQIRSEAEEIQVKLDQRKAEEEAKRTANETDRTGTDTGTGGDGNDPFAGLDSKEEQLRLQYEEERQQLFDDYDQLEKTANREYRSLIRGIKAQFQNRMNLMKDTNSRYLAAQGVNNKRSGNARFAAEMAAGLMTEEEQMGHMRLMTIESEMTSLITAAAQAKQEGDLEAFNALYDNIDEAFNRMNEQIKANFDNAVKRNQEIRANNQEQRLKQAAETKDMLDKSSRAAPALVSRVADLPSNVAAQVIEEYARQSGLDVEILLGDMVTAQQEMQKNSLDMANIESQIIKRQQDTALDWTREQRLQRESDEKETQYTDVALNIAEGIQTLNDVDDKDYNKVVAELRDLGFYSDEPPQWFVATVQEDFKDLMDAKGGAPDPDWVRKKWNELRSANGIEINTTNRFRPD